MAGFIVHNQKSDEQFLVGGQGFHIGPEVADMILDRAPHKRVITLQLDGDELDAALWGLTNYVKGGSVMIRHTHECGCGVHDCYALPKVVI